VLTTGAIPHVRRRALFTVVDQGLSSVSNFLLGIAVARAVSVSGYGAFAVGFSLYGIGLGVARAFGTDPLLVRYSDHGDDGVRAEAGAAIGAAIVVGAVLGAVLAVAGIATGGTVGGVCLAFGVGLPFVFGQEAYRYLLIGLRRAHLACAADAAWIAAFVIALVTPALRDASSPTPFVVAWCATGAGSLVLAAALSGAAPRLGAAWPWARRHTDLGPRFAVEYVVASAGSHVVIWLTGVVAGLDEGAALRGAYVVLAPIWIAATGMVAAAVPEGVRLKGRSLPALVRRVRALAAGLALLSVAWGVAASLLPDGAGEAVLGDTWDHTQPLLVLAGIYGAGFVATSGLVTGLRALAAARRSFAATIPIGLLVIAGGVAGAAIGDARGALLGMLGPSLLGVAVVAWQFHLAVQDEAAAPTPPY
jgi:O-antigen/teichoic acid export membrane protein